MHTGRTECKFNLYLSFWQRNIARITCIEIHQNLLTSLIISTNITKTPMPAVEVIGIMGSIKQQIKEVYQSKFINGKVLTYNSWENRSFWGNQHELRIRSKEIICKLNMKCLAQELQDNKEHINSCHQCTKIHPRS